MPSWHAEAITSQMKISSRYCRQVADSAKVYLRRQRIWHSPAWQAPVGWLHPQAESFWCWQPWPDLWSSGSSHSDSPSKGAFCLSTPRPCLCKKTTMPDLDSENAVIYRIKYSMHVWVFFESVANQKGLVSKNAQIDKKAAIKFIWFGASWVIHALQTLRAEDTMLIRLPRASNIGVRQACVRDLRAWCNIFLCKTCKQSLSTEQADGGFISWQYRLKSDVLLKILCSHTFIVVCLTSLLRSCPAFPLW